MRWKKKRDAIEDKWLQRDAIEGKMVLGQNVGPKCEDAIEEKM